MIRDCSQIRRVGQFSIAGRVKFRLPKAIDWRYFYVEGGREVKFPVNDMFTFANLLKKEASLNLSPLE